MVKHLLYNNLDFIEASFDYPYFYNQIQIEIENKFSCEVDKVQIVTKLNKIGVQNPHTLLMNNWKMS